MNLTSKPAAFGIVFYLVLITGVVFKQADASPILSSPPPNLTQTVILEPVSDFQVRTYYYGSRPRIRRFCLDSSEADCLDEGINRFFDLRSFARIYDKFTVRYDGQFNNGQYRTKKIFLELPTGNLLWKYGKDSIWLGHGVHGSLLLSSHSEGFLLFKIQTKEAKQLPWFFSSLGRFEYLFFHGWLNDFRIVGQRLDYWPSSILQLGLNQTAIYNERFQVWEIPKVLSASEENIEGRFDNDQRASVDIALHLPFLREFSIFRNGKVFAEYAGEDLIAFWQKEDGWSGPLGFDLLLLGTMGGIFLTTGELDIRTEYSQNYRNSPVWYTKIPFKNKNVLMGHHMGRDADDFFFGVTKRWEAFSIELAYDRERHGIKLFPGSPEIRNQFIINPIYKIKKFDLFSHFIFSRYTNVDVNPDPLTFDIQEGRHRNEFTIGFGISINN